jgi:hypothetical protein
LEVKGKAMNCSNNLKELQQSLIDEITAERNSEMAQSMAAKRSANSMAVGFCSQDTKALEAAGLNVPALEALELENEAKAEAELKDIRSQMEASVPSQSMLGDTTSIDSALLPSGAMALTSNWSGHFSDSDPQDALTGGSDINAQAIIGAGGGCKNSWNWARGGGWGCSGGVGSNQQWADWTFWFRPESSRFYTIRPHFQFRGFYIVRANDKWYNCKGARVLVSAWTNVYQYNWKGWNHVNVLDVSDDNINVNRRLDTDRHTNNSYLLGGGDWAAIRCTIGLYVRAKGSGSYAENNFSVGNNRICVPHVHVN